MTVAIPVVLEVHTSGDQVLAPELNLSCEPGATMVQLLDATYDELRRAGIDDPLNARQPDFCGFRIAGVEGDIVGATRPYADIVGATRPYVGVRPDEHWYWTWDIGQVTLSDLKKSSQAGLHADPADGVVLVAGPDRIGDGVLDVDMWLQLIGALYVAAQVLDTSGGAIERLRQVATLMRRGAKVVERKHEEFESRGAVKPTYLAEAVTIVLRFGCRPWPGDLGFPKRKHA